VEAQWFVLEVVSLELEIIIEKSLRAKRGNLTNIKKITMSLRSS
jgi:hypothetical protein